MSAGFGTFVEGVFYVPLRSVRSTTRTLRDNLTVRVFLCHWQPTISQLLVVANYHYVHNHQRLRLQDYATTVKSRQVHAIATSKG